MSNAPAPRFGVGLRDPRIGFDAIDVGGYNPMPPKGMSPAFSASRAAGLPNASSTPTGTERSWILD
jgi:hypothetical protein